MKKMFAIMGFVLALFLVFTLAMTSSVGEPSNFGATINYDSRVCVDVIRVDGSIEKGDCSHNVLFNTGKDLIKQYLGDTGGTTDEIDQIQLCNATAGCGAPSAGKTEDFTAFTSGGLSETTGTFASTAGNGNWTITNTFTASSNDLVTNVTRLRNTNGDDFAGNSFSTVTLQSGDQLQITWNIFVS